MNVLRSLLLLIFTILSSVTMNSRSVSASEIVHPQTDITYFAQVDDIGFAARAPPIAGSNVAVTGGVTVRLGSAFALHGQETVVALFGFGVDLDATNNVGAVPDNWTRLNPAGAQINAPRGYTTYRTPDGDMVHVSPSGLQYGADPKFGNRVDHVLDHTAPNPNKPTHTVFNAQGDDALSLVDEAWTRRG